jgi:hypothetical protein
MPAVATTRFPLQHELFVVNLGIAKLLLTAISNKLQIKSYVVYTYIWHIFYAQLGHPDCKITKKRIWKLKGFWCRLQLYCLVYTRFMLWRLNYCLCNGCFRPRWSTGNVLAIGLNVREFKPGPRRWIFKAIKIRSTTSFWVEIKTSVPCRTIYVMLKNPTSMKVILRRQNSAAIYRQDIVPRY